MLDTLVGAPEGLRARAAWIWERYPRRPALFWTGNISYRIGSWIVAVLYGSRVTPNQLTLAGLVTHAIGAIAVGVLPLGPSPLYVVLILAIWQVAFGFDCADGLLARARGRTSPFGAWLDQIVDFASHATVFAALALFMTRSLNLTAEASALLAIGTFAANSIQGYAVGLKASSAVTGRAITQGRTGIAAVTVRLLDLTDYPFLLFVSSVLLLAPLVLLGYLVAAGALSVGAVCVQLVLYRRFKSP